MTRLMSTVDAAATSATADPMWYAVAAILVLAAAGIVLVFRRSGAEDDGPRYEDAAYDPVAAAERARARSEAAAQEAADETAQAPSPADEAVDAVAEEPKPEAVEEVIDPEVVAREKAALEAERKEAFAAKKEADLRAREARKAQRALEAEQSAQRRADELEAQRAEFEADRRAAYRIGLSKTRSGFLGKIGSLLSGGAAIDDAVMDDLEAILFTSDIGARTADRLLEDLKQRRGSGRLKNADAVFAALREELASIVNLPAPSLFDDLKAGETKVVMLVGVNGVGKTTSMGKLAHRAKQGGHSVLLGAGDTFRAAAVDQLQVWAERTDSPLVRGADQADPSSVLFETVSRGVSDGFDLVLCDTAGRLHTRAELMDELKKMHRVMGKAHEGAPHQVILVLDATIGQNAIAQARTFVDAIPLDGIILTKLDGTARGGVIAGICDELKLPVYYIGVGEAVEDLRAFDPDEFVAALVESFGEQT